MVKQICLYMLWFNFILGLSFIFFCFELIIIHYHTQKQKKIEFKRRRKSNHNIYQSFSHQVIFLLILTTFSLDYVLILLGENWLWTFLGLIGLRHSLQPCWRTFARWSQSKKLGRVSLILVKSNLSGLLSMLCSDWLSYY